jgi:prevent-host-death family protein
MSETTVSLAEAKARLSELTERAAAGESVVITKRGKPIVQIVRIGTKRQPIDAGALRSLTDRQESGPMDSGEFLRSLRADARY